MQLWSNWNFSFPQRSLLIFFQAGLSNKTKNEAHLNIDLGKNQKSSNLRKICFEQTY